MKLWELTVVVEAEDNYDSQRILAQLDMEANRGDGIYLQLGKATIKPMEKGNRNVLSKTKKRDL